MRCLRHGESGDRARFRRYAPYPSLDRFEVGVVVVVVDDSDGQFVACFRDAVECVGQCLVGQFAASDTEQYFHSRACMGAVKKPPG